MLKKACVYCEKEFYSHPEETWRLYCTKVCQEGAAQRKNYPQIISKQMVQLNCQRCDQPFPRANVEKWVTCCSQTCAELLLITVTCRKCKKPFTVTAAEKWKRLCGRIDCFKQDGPERKNTGIKPYSSKAIIWIESIAQQEKINIQHEKNGGEFSIPWGKTIIKFDGYHEESKTVYEFHGDYWHGNPEYYGKDQINEYTGTTFGTLYEKTLQREEYIRSQGYKLVTIWESEFDARY